MIVEGNVAIGQVLDPVVVDLMIIFVFETVVMPLLTLLVLLLILGVFLRPGTEPAPTPRAELP